MNQYWKLSSISVGFCFFLLKPLFLYWKLPQGPATVFIWSTCFLTNMFVPFPLVSCRCTCYHFFFSEHLFSFSFFLCYFGASVLISFCLCFWLPEQLFSYSFLWVFSEHLFSYRFVCVFCCRSSCSHIVCSGFFRSICSLIVFFCCFFGESVLISFYSGFFWLPQHLFSYIF